MARTSQTSRRRSKDEQKSGGKSTRASASAKAKNKKKSEKKAKKKKKKAPKALTAATADKYFLYQHSVQSPEHDAEFFADVYRSKHKRKPRHLREDFSGTGLLAATWAAQGNQYTADGYDIDPEPVAWGKRHNIAPLGSEVAKRVRLHLKDARTPSKRRPDIRVALNFSYFIFKRRDELLEYLQSACEDMADDGLFVLDIYGGPDAYQEMEETRKIDKGFTYVWDQTAYWPVTGEYQTYIHFRFPDGSEMERAFSYDWRLWGLPELTDLLYEAGFAQVDSYWEGTADNGTDGDGVYKKSVRGENCLAWVTYVMAWK